MNKSDLLRFNDLLLTKQQELSTHNNQVGSIPTSAEPCADSVDMAASEIGAVLQIWRNETESNLLRAIEDALARIRQGRFGTCEECEQAISKSSLEAVPCPTNPAIGAKMVVYCKLS
jgi:RNA polymerase-binding transcription factor